jgi:hypothetical protein
MKEEEITKIYRWKQNNEKDTKVVCEKEMQGELYTIAP